MAERASAICDPAERCTGSSADCPGDAQAADDTICQSDGTLCGSAKDCHICRSGACLHNDGHWNASCVPSCGTIRRYCGVEVDCCSASSVCTFGEPGGASYDCGKCCELSCCEPSSIEETNCWDGQDEDCDGPIDCDDPGCDGQYCGASRWCVSGVCYG